MYLYLDVVLAMSWNLKSILDLYFLSDYSLRSFSGYYHSCGIIHFTSIIHKAIIFHSFVCKSWFFCLPYLSSSLHSEDPYSTSSQSVLTLNPTPSITSPLISSPLSHQPLEINFLWYELAVDKYELTIVKQELDVQHTTTT